MRPIPRPAKWGVLLLGLAILLYLGFVHHLDTYQVGIHRNYLTGETTMEPRPGFYVTPPWVLVARIDTRPQRVCLTTASRAVNCKLAQFAPEHWQEFVAMEGFHYYWWYNRVSFNWGYAEEYRGMSDILRGYAFSSRQYPFVKVLLDYPQG